MLRYLWKKAAHGSLLMLLLAPVSWGFLGFVQMASEKTRPPVPAAQQTLPPAASAAGAASAGDDLAALHLDPAKFHSGFIPPFIRFVGASLCILLTLLGLCLYQRWPLHAVAAASAAYIRCNARNLAGILVFGFALNIPLLFLCFRLGGVVFANVIAIGGAPFAVLIVSALYRRLPRSAPVRAGSGVSVYFVTAHILMAVAILSYLYLGYGNFLVDGSPLFRQWFATPVAPPLPTAAPPGHLVWLLAISKALCAAVGLLFVEALDAGPFPSLASCTPPDSALRRSLAARPRMAGLLTSMVKVLVTQFIAALIILLGCTVFHGAVATPPQAVLLREVWFFGYDLGHLGLIFSHWWWLLVPIILFPSFAAYVLLYLGLPAYNSFAAQAGIQIRASTWSSMLSFVEPLLAAVVAIAFLGEGAKFAYPVLMVAVVAAVYSTVFLFNFWDVFDSMLARDKRVLFSSIQQVLEGARHVNASVKLSSRRLDGSDGLQLRLQWGDDSQSERVIRRLSPLLWTRLGHAIRRGLSGGGRKRAYTGLLCEPGHAAFWKSLHAVRLPQGGPRASGDTETVRCLCRRESKPHFFQLDAAKVQSLPSDPLCPVCGESLSLNSPDLVDQIHSELYDISAYVSSVRDVYSGRSLYSMRPKQSVDEDLVNQGQATLVRNTSLCVVIEAPTKNDPGLPAITAELEQGLRSLFDTRTSLLQQGLTLCTRPGASGLLLRSGTVEGPGPSVKLSWHREQCIENRWQWPDAPGGERLILDWARGILYGRLHRPYYLAYDYTAPGDPQARFLYGVLVIKNYRRLFPAESYPWRVFERNEYDWLCGDRLDEPYALTLRDLAAGKLLEPAEVHAMAQGVESFARFLDEVVLPFAVPEVGQVRLSHVFAALRPHVLDPDHEYGSSYLSLISDGESALTADDKLLVLAVPPMQSDHPRLPPAATSQWLPARVLFDALVTGREEVGACLRRSADLDHWETGLCFANRKLGPLDGADGPPPDGSGGSDVRGSSMDSDALQRAYGQYLATASLALLRDIGETAASEPHRRALFHNFFLLNPLE